MDYSYSVYLPPTNFSVRYTARVESLMYNESHKLDVPRLGSSYRDRTAELRFHRSRNPRPRAPLRKPADCP